MKTFETEFGELKNWLLDRTKEWQNKTKEYKNVGHDCEEEYMQHENILEYNRRLTELKKKYGKDTDSISVMGQESNSPKTKKVHA